ncbi:Alpha-ketoglutarate-dependent dioxygenase FTO [Chelonia mydas]|uniref:Alpha-ketoglutarate-dependent dioxygenase FTO n=1 Tax=Chelonia mydas TaxID=8469 RepID=M7BTW5_CHEMY|nr:Alpha-ketoglutarate-dependent dioxygenase FTO [Chelonia mydas]
MEDYEIKYCHPELFAACKALIKLNDYLNVEAVQALQEQNLSETKETENTAVTDREQDFSTFIKGSLLEVQSSLYTPRNDCTSLKYRTSYNLTLLNYMDPLQMPYLKQEPYFGMGNMAVSWHHDENLIERSTVAVYNYSCEGSACDKVNEQYVEGRDPADWHLGLKCSTGTLEYIFGQCEVALQNLQVDSDSAALSLKSLEVQVVKEVEGIHNEVEFEWLRQFWFQGKRYRKCTDWWFEPMAKLEEFWKKMEFMGYFHVADWKRRELHIMEFEAVSIKGLWKKQGGILVENRTPGHPEYQAQYDLEIITIKGKTGKESSSHWKSGRKSKAVPQNGNQVKEGLSCTNMDLNSPPLFQSPGEGWTSLVLCEVGKGERTMEQRNEIISCFLPLLTERQELRKEWTASYYYRVTDILVNLSADTGINWELPSGNQWSYTSVRPGALSCTVFLSCIPTHPVLRKGPVNTEKLCQHMKNLYP